MNFKELLGSLIDAVRGKKRLTSDESTKQVLDYERAVRARNNLVDGKVHNQPHNATPKDYVYSGLDNGKSDFSKKVAQIPRATVIPTRLPTQRPTRTPTITPIPTKAPIKTGGYEQFLEQSIFPQTRQAGLPDALVAGQWATEGGRATGNPQNNVWGLMRGGKLIQYPNLNSSTRDYILTVQNILKKKGYDPKKMSAKEILQALQEGNKLRYEAHNPNPQDYVNLVSNTPEYRKFLFK